MKQKAAVTKQSHEVRIIGGQWKRSKLAVADKPGLRPTPDRVRETLFNWLGQDLTGWRCIDAFAGTGALGFEAASRGAREVLLVEQDTALVAQLKRVHLQLQASATQIVRGLSTLTLSMPGFWLGLVLLILFAVIYPFFPISGFGRGFGDILWHLALPALTITLSLAPILIRTLRASLIEIMHAPHVEYARTKGLSQGRLIRRHVLRNGLLATVTILGVNIGWLIGGSVVVETVFSLPGIGALIVSSISARDYPMIQGIALIFGLLVVVINLITDLVYAALDPRVSYD